MRGYGENCRQLLQEVESRADNFWRRGLVELETPSALALRSVRAAYVGRRALICKGKSGYRLSNCVNDAPADARVGQKVEINRLANHVRLHQPSLRPFPRPYPIADHTVWDFDLDCVSAWRKARNAITALLIRSRSNARRFSLDDQIG